MDAYKVLKRIGVGTYGSAYLVCSSVDPTQQFVLKKVKIDEDDVKERQQAELEVSVLSSLNHPLVLGYIDHFMYKGHLCIVTEYCEAGDLYSLLRARKAPVPEAQILEWLVQVVLAIQYVHTKNILHRDLKTQNIFLTKDGLIKLGDFGISRPLNSSLDLASTIIGTPYYMSPEVMSSQPYDFKSDMWSLGCCLYEMTSLKHAFDASDMSSLVCKIMRGEHLPIPQHLSPELKELTKALLSRVPAKRPAPDAILKLPWLKEYVQRAKDKVARLDALRPPARRGSGAPPPGVPRSNSDAGALDRELEAAKARLAHIQNQRDALAALKEAAAARLSAAQQQQQQQQQQQRRQSNSGNGVVPVAGSGNSGSGKHGGGGGGGSGGAEGGGVVPAHRRASRGASMDGSGGGVPSGGGAPPPGAGRPPPAPLPSSHSAPMDPKARREAKKAEEIRQREAELLDARRAYYEERKQAEAKKWHMIHGETGGHAHTAGRRDTASNGFSGGDERHSNGDGLHRYTGSRGDEMDDLMSLRGGGPAHTRRGSLGDGAAADFEAELQLLNQGAPLAPGQTFLRTLSGGGPGVSVADRAAALREVCTLALGPQLLDLLSGVIRQRLKGGADDVYFRQELMSRLGPHRLQYLQLVDAMVFFEEAAAAGG